MSRRNHRIPIPKKPEEVIRLVAKVVAKHEKDGDASILRLLEMAGLKRSFIMADTENKNGKEFRQKSETCMQKRDNLVGARAMNVGTLRHGLACVRSALLAHHKGSERALADWGFEVHGSAPAVADEEKSA
jgi:hypothetical protein